MTKVYAGLALGMLLLGATAIQAGDGPAAVPQPQCTRFTQCEERFLDWLTYRPLESSCGHWTWQGNVIDSWKAHRADKAAHCANGSGCCCGGYPCCTQLYVYYLDRCAPNFGYALPVGQAAVAPPPADTAPPADAPHP